MQHNVSAFTQTRSKAFTLLELLVVVVILGLISSVVVISVRRAGPEAQLPIEVERFIEVLQFAQDEAIYKNREYGVILAEDGYQFAYYEFDAREWVPIEEDRILGVHKLPDGMMLSLELEGEPLDFPDPITEDDETNRFDTDDDDNDEDKEKITPQLWLYSSGDLLPAFNLQFIVETEQSRYIYTVVGEFDGHLTEKEPEVR